MRPAAKIKPNTESNTTVSCYISNLSRIPCALSILVIRMWWSMQREGVWHSEAAAAAAAAAAAQAAAAQAATVMARQQG
jgi:hypothetical protein